MPGGSLPRASRAPIVSARWWPGGKLRTTPDGRLAHRGVTFSVLPNSKRLVKPLVVKVDAPDPSALCGRIAELQRMGGGLVRIEGFCVGPGGHHFIVIDARRRPPIDVVAQGAGLLLAGFGERLDVRDGCFGDGGIAAAEIHMLHHVERAKRNSAPSRIGKGQK